MRKFVLTIDDLSPHPRTGLDFKVIKLCDQLIQKHPSLKINLFTCAAFARLGQKPPSYLHSNLEWVDKIKLLGPNYRIGLHAFYHRRTNPKYPQSNNDEFQYLDYKGTKDLIKYMEDEFKKVGLKHEKTFRPPAWKISFDAARCFTDNGYLIAGSKEYYDKYKTKISNLRWKSFNWDMTKECKIKDSSILAFCHSSDWTKNYFNQEKANWIDKLLSSERFNCVFVEDF